MGLGGGVWVEGAELAVLGVVLVWVLEVLGLMILWIT